ncbi:double zinc ribbon domain-containing protein, partial [Thiocapsa sp.]
MSALLPPTCVLCGAPGLATGGWRDLCPGCAAELPHNRDSCLQC